ncbi:hypothetical protein ARHIZOSPH14_20920 [Agromyces rhizosphaerae]|uniref:Uncharacterized protein n=1 Tax=Agromyces rhizosphaerae TaxID=88374 RepID=A0A9W6CWY2_9MICO|nr:hypothetical protein ARHIZOSPH14_20920 [Agromyces rhizosphaerae]
MGPGVVLGTTADSQAYVHFRQIPKRGRNRSRDVPGRLPQSADEPGSVALGTSLVRGPSTTSAGNTKDRAVRCYCG